eukprot:15198456-Alexandrium_andersonii.AAC.1
MKSSAPTRLERFGAVSCRPQPALLGGLPPPAPPQVAPPACAGAFCGGPEGGAHEEGDGGAQETAPNRSKR